MAAAVSASGPSGFLQGQRDTIMALTPFVALVLFFVMGTWLWFLLIPVMGILLYGADGNTRQRRQRR